MGDWIKPDVAFKEQYTSAALNRKLAGVLPVGVHWGLSSRARLFGYRLKFRFEWGRFYVPRFIWTMPTEHRTEQRVIAAAGFENELAAIIPALFCGLWQYPVAAVAHLIAYQFYAGDSNDFHYL